MPGDVDADFGHGFDGVGIDRGGLRAGAQNLCPVAKGTAGEPFGHLAARRVGDAEEEDALHRTGSLLAVRRGSAARRSKCARERLARATRESITGTSTRTPTTVTRAAPEFRPKSPIATATASSKKFEVPMRAQGAATL